MMKLLRNVTHPDPITILKYIIFNNNKNINNLLSGPPICPVCNKFVTKNNCSNFFTYKNCPNIKN